MLTEELVQDLHKLFEKHQLTTGMLVIPDHENKEFYLCNCAMSMEHLRQLGYMLVKHLPDDRGPLN